MLSLLKSRKFWLTVTAVVALAIQLQAKQINGATFSALATALIMGLVYSIAHEDSAQKAADGATGQAKVMADAVKSNTASMFGGSGDTQ